MTVCIAAIYNNNSVLSISDRMITAGDIQFEPPSPKIFNVTNSIAVMTAGDASLQLEIIRGIAPKISAKIDENPQKWLPVSYVAELYRDEYISIRRSLAEKEILVPYGLDYDRFINRQHEMSEDFLSDLSFKLQRFGIGNVATIVTGIDEDGPHIFTIRNDQISWDDRVGFTAVGIGDNHALSHFMLAGYAPSASEPKALLTIHQAKKKAEVSPGVGEQTDLFVIGPNPGTYQKLDAHPEVGLDIIKSLDGFYEGYKKSIARLDASAENKIKDYLSNMVAKASPPQKAESPTEPEKGVEDGKPENGKGRKAA